MSVNEYYPGAEMSALSADCFVQDFVRKDTIALDRKLFNTKWWDYRLMHPTHATHYFYHLYNRILPEYIAENFGEREGQLRRRMKVKPFKECSTQVIRGFWKARMAADALGVPYDIYIRETLNHFYGCYNTFATTKRFNHKTPFPVHLYSDGIVRRVIRRWDEEKSVELRIPENELILGQDVPFRNAMEQSLIADAARTDHPEYFIAKARRAGAITSPD